LNSLLVFSKLLVNELNVFGGYFMRTFSKEELNKILENHKHWINEDVDNWEYMRANLSEANLHGADLYGANLREANLYGADLYGADLSEANLHGANLIGVKNIPYILLSCPSDGSFIGWKSAIAETEFGYYKCIIKLQILEDSKRSSATNSKCRCDKAKVLGIELLNDVNEEIIRAHSYYDYSFIYKVGEIVLVDNFDDDRWNECAPGIHFFINKQEAIDY
jgi:hypothetical protein